MKKWLTKYLVPLLLLAVALALYLDARSVITIDPQAARYAPAGSGPQVEQVPRGESRLRVGERYASLEELAADQREAGYLRTGSFGRHWPAMVTEIQTDDDGIRFVRKNGTPHEYTGFDGYRMQVVHLSGPGDQETVVVFRSAQKRAAGKVRVRSAEAKRGL